ncbi:competence/damage-inducible protein CinA [Bacteriovorax sp. BSW11_IV]|uniref:CinA family nicotinamide mononucleotide deamidase-related protein n=1 Tax=Bacteriovorax sp. BSW11_IV TaxID=1353529 RepID=UPI00038A4BFA|nr:CinA family nicotinamide mononucleotide deamidase-related protein [Bacteriovorax sp. BSW11_IV]EQC50224.1 competence/damage-inducible protein CinA [Bacteriovorax sp. BSW11_IV]
MNIGLLVIGDEILNGKISDLNAAWLTRFVQQTPLALKSVIFVKDDEKEMMDGLKYLSERSDIILTTGGIGPTKDDKTKEVMAKFHGKKLIENQDAKNLAIKLYQKINREWSADKSNYHMLPEDFIATDNPGGLAPGLVFHTEDKIYMSAPGVPREFQLMFEQVFLPIILDKAGDDRKEYEIFNIRTFGIPEEKIFFELCPNLWEELETFGKVASLPQVTGVDITLVLEKNNEIENKKNKIKAIIENSPLKESIWQYGMLSLPSFILEVAKSKKLTFSFAESCTGGLSSSRITDISGSSAAFLGGVVAYDNQVKIDLLGVKENTLKTYGAVSAQTAKEMAEGCRTHLKTDLAISYSGIAGPGGGSVEKPVGTVAIGWATANDSGSDIYHFHGDREKLKMRFSEKGLYKLLELINTIK